MNKQKFILIVLLSACMIRFGFMFKDSVRNPSFKVIEAEENFDEATLEESIEELFLEIQPLLQEVAQNRDQKQYTHLLKGIEQRVIVDMSNRGQKINPQTARRYIKRIGLRNQNQRN